MQKKKLYQLAAAIVFVVAVAAALILTGMRKSTPVSEAQASSVPSSALSGGEAEEPSSAAASSESAVSSEVTEESPVSSFLEQLEEELGISSSETASSSEVSSAASAGKADSVSSAVSGSSAAHSVPASSAASGSHAASSQAPGSSHASGSSAASENEVDARIDSYIRQLQNLKRQTESKLYGVIYEAYDEYISHPVEERNLGMKVSIVVSKTAKLTSVQGECDKEFNAILKELRQYLRDNGRDQSVADQAEQEYKKMKSDLTSELTGIVYNSAVGSGDGGKWIQEHIEQFKRCTALLFCYCTRFNAVLMRSANCSRRSRSWTMESMSLSEMTLTGAERLLTPAFSVPLRAALTPWAGISTWTSTGMVSSKSRDFSGRPTTRTAASSPSDGN